jgi:hypothetical protein
MQGATIKEISPGTFTVDTTYTTAKNLFKSMVFEIRLETECPLSIFITAYKIGTESSTLM